jgi:hypothetical protein
VSVGCEIGLREAELPTPAFLILDLRFSIARPSLDFQSKVASRNRRKYWPGIFVQRFSVARSVSQNRSKLRVFAPETPASGFQRNSLPEMLYILRNWRPRWNVDAPQLSCILCRKALPGLFTKARCLAEFFPRGTAFCLRTTYETKLTANACIALCSSTNAVSISWARTTKRFPSGGGRSYETNPDNIFSLSDKNWVDLDKYHPPKRCGVVSNRQISQTDNQETSPPRTRPTPFGTSCGNATEGRNTRCEADAVVRSLPDALALTAPLGRTKMATGLASGSAPGR